MTKKMSGSDRRNSLARGEENRENHENHENRARNTRTVEL